MQSPDGPTRDSMTRQPSTCERSSKRSCEPVDARPFGLANACIVAVMLSVAVAAVAVECGFYKAFDDNWFDLERSALPSVLSLVGLGTALADTAAPRPQPAGTPR